jgi:hypothetical protein
MRIVFKSEPNSGDNQLLPEDLYIGEKIRVRTVELSQ